MHTLVSAARRALLPCVACLLLAACNGDSGTSTGTSAAQLTSQEVNGPRATGDVATDGLSWINYRRLQAGLAVTQRDARIDRAAAAHASYQQLNNLVTHDEEPSKTGFTGVTSPDRLRAAGYYWLNVNFVATLAGHGLGPGRVVTWPMPDQKNVRTSFLSDEETPDPVAGQNEVGFPVSVHADGGTTLRVSRFVIRERGGAEIRTKLLEHQSDNETPASAAAIIPLTVLRRGVSYEVEFSGTVDGTPVTRSWSFST